jgi:5-methylcytosine-specific restriction endonuclease McrA
MAQQAEELELDVIEREAQPQTRYSSFLQSREWKEITLRVIKRAGGVCEACGVREAKCVHHTTRVFGRKPPLWTLKAVCSSCHARFRPGARRDDWKASRDGERDSDF